jgi:hypothetical protein
VTATAGAVKLRLSPGLRHSTGIPLVAPLHVTKSAAVLYWADRVAHCVVSHRGPALRSDTVTVPYIITVSMSILVCAVQRRFGQRQAAYTTVVP